MISGIGWVSELIEIAGGEDVLPKLRFQQAAKDRIILPDTVRDTAPDVILASWCGKKVVPDRIRQRPGWSDIPAVRNNRIVEIKSPLILQPGPAALTDGLDAIVKALWPECVSESERIATALASVRQLIHASRSIAIASMRMRIACAALQQ